MAEAPGLGRLVLLWLTVWLVGCASQRPPTGGPPDTTPPTVLGSKPEPGSTHVPRDQVVEFEFSEGMDHKSLERALFVTPNPGDRLKVQWKGRRLRLKFLDSLKVDRTYVITLGTDLRDAHGNQLDASYTLAFSTGEEISNGKIQGQVFSKGKVQGVLIWAYILEPGVEPDPRAREGDYITQTDTRGKFELTHLSEGRYRVFAIDDTDNNRFFETGVDGLGVPTQDVVLTEDHLSRSNLFFRVTVQDTIGPALVAVDVRNQRRLTLEFDEELNATSASNPANYAMRRLPRRGDSLRVRLAYLSAVEPRKVALVTDVQQAGAKYEVEVTNVTDLSGNIVDPGFRQAEFVGSALPDTAHVQVVAHAPEDSARAVPLETAVTVHFNVAVDSAGVQRGFQLTGADGNAVRGRFRWLTPASFEFKPAALLNSLTPYAVTLPLDSVRAVPGPVAGRDTLRFVFTTVNRDTLSSISGVVRDPDSTATGAIYVRAVQTENEAVSYQIRLSEPGPYRFDNMLPGTYVLEAFRDRDGNGRYSFGQAVPFEPAERFFVFPEPIKVRARWPNEGNDLAFPVVE